MAVRYSLSILDGSAISRSVSHVSGGRADFVLAAVFPGLNEPALDLRCEADMGTGGLGL